MASKNLRKLIAINFLIFIVLLFGPGVAYSIYEVTETFRNSLKKKSSDVRINYPTYPNKERANQIYLDLLKIKSKYRSF